MHVRKLIKRNFINKKKGGSINLKKNWKNKRDIYLLIIIITGGGMVENKVKRCRKKKERKKASSGESFIYYNNLYRVIYKTLSGKLNLVKSELVQ